MDRWRRLATSAVVLFGVLCATPSAAQAPANDRGHVRFSESVRVPGVTLDAGHYMFVLRMPVGGQAIVDIYRAGDAAHVASCLAVEVKRTGPSAAAFVNYSGVTPAALKSWFVGGSVIGFQFVYPPSEAKTIYLATGEPVPFGTVQTIRPDMVGTYGVAMTGESADSLQPVGTSGGIPVAPLAAANRCSAAEKRASASGSGKRRRYPHAASTCLA